MGTNQRAQIVMSDDEIAEFIEHSRTCTMATVGPDGTPHLVAMWYAVIDGQIWFETKSRAQKTVNLRRNPRITVSIEAGYTYDQLRGVSIEGTGVVVDDADALWNVGVNVFERYTGPYTDEMKPFVEVMLNKRVAVRVDVDRIRTWDHRKLGMDPMPLGGSTAQYVPGSRADGGSYGAAVILAAAVLDVVFVLTAFGARTLVQQRRTGEHGWRLGRPHSGAEAAARSLMVGSGVLLVVALFVGEGSTGLVAAVGIVVAAGAIALVTVAQLQMGASWRIGVDPAETTALVQTGLYRYMRNPIYTGMVMFTVGQAVMLTSLVAWIAVAAMFVGIEIQVRAVEEPYLSATHGAAFVRLQSTAGRFVPLVGRAR